MKKMFILCLLTAILLPCLSTGKELPIGKTKTTRGDVVIVRGGKELPVSIGDMVYPNDTIRTGTDSTVGIIFEDNTILSLGPNSVVIIEEYIFAPEKGVLSMVARILRGTASYLSGIIGKQSPEAVKFHTPDATIGIRGTQFLVSAESL